MLLATFVLAFYGCFLKKYDLNEMGLYVSDTLIIMNKSIKDFASFPKNDFLTQLYILRTNHATYNSCLNLLLGLN